MEQYYLNKFKEVIKLINEYKVNLNVTNDKNDWRFMGQDEYLMNVKLMYHFYDHTIRDHDHCEFCMKKFSNNTGDLHEGYCTLDEYCWICERCYNDFRKMFMWEVVKHKPG